MTSIVQKLKTHFFGMTVEKWLQTIAGVWLWIVAALLLSQKADYYTLVFAVKVSWAPLAVLFVAGTLFLFLLGALGGAEIEGNVLTVGAVVVVLLLALKAESSTRLYLYPALAIVTAAVMYYAASRGILQLPRIKLGRPAAAILVGVLFCAIAAGVGIVGVSRYVTFRAPNFDFGIFCQMFHNMKETFLPLTTCERNELMSHFAVHISPIYYLMLPAYAIFPSPVTLQISQALVVASGVIPMYLLANRTLGRKVAVVMAFVYAAYPAISCGCLYDLHENCFLAPLLLWMFCAFEYKKWPQMFVAAALVLMVKEDAAEYVMLFAVYIMLSRKEWRRGGVLLGSAVLWFAVALILLNAFGDGDMSGRYAALSADGSLFGLLHTAVTNPGLILKTIFAPVSKDNEPHKRRYLIQLLVPLITMLFTRRRFSRYLLLVPVVVNLLSGWVYQTDITFQYSFGVSAFLLYLCVLNLQDMSHRDRSAAVCYAAVSALALYLLIFLPTLRHNVNALKDYKPTATRLQQIFDLVPEDASVTTSTFFLPHLAQRAEVYEDFYHPEPDADYLVLDLRYGTEESRQKIIDTYYSAGYTFVAQEDKLALVLKSPNA